MPPWSIGYHPNEFTPIFSNISCPVEFQIRPGKKYCSKWVEIHEFTPNLTGHKILLNLGIISIDLLPFGAIFHARSNSTGQEILLQMEVNSLGLYLYASLVNWVSSQ